MQLKKDWAKAVKKCPAVVFFLRGKTWKISYGLFMQANNYGLMQLIMHQLVIKIARRTFPKTIRLNAY